jgi:hypothetical protein
MWHKLIILGLGLWCASAVADDARPAGDKPAEKITYEQHILPLLREKCGSCHNANDKKGDLVLDNYSAAMRGGASGEVIRTDGDAENSPLYRVVAHLDEPFMPPQQPRLPDDQLALLRKWIEGGALENAGSTAKVKKTSMVAKVEISNQRPAGPPPLPENLPLDPVTVSPRANGATALAVNPWSPLLAVSSHKQILLYHTDTLELAGVLPFPEGQPHVLRFSRNGQLLLAAGGRGAQSGQAVVFDVKTGQRLAQVGGEYDVVLAADISPDQTLVALGGPKKIVRCYDLATGELVYEKNKHTDWVTALEFSPDGVLLATGDRSNGLIVWEAYTGREFYVLTGHTNSITDVSWSPDSNVLASASEDAAIKLWEMQNGNQVKSFGAHGGGTTAARFARDGRLVSFGRDRTPKLWDAAGNNQRSFAALPDVGTEIVLCCETDRVFVADLTGAIHVYQAKDGAAVGQLTTNPPSLAAQIEQARHTLAQLEAVAAQAAAQLAALQKGITDRQSAAEAAQKAATEAAAAVEPLAKAHAGAVDDLAAKTRILQAAETTLSNSETAKTKAVAEKEAAVKALADANAAMKAAVEAVAAAETALIAAQQTAEAKPADPAARQSAADAARKFAEALAGLSSATQKKVELAPQLSQRSEAVVQAVAAVQAAQAGRDSAAMAKLAAEKLAAEAATRLKAAQEAAVVRKTEAEKAVAAAQVSSEQQKQLADAEAAAKAAANNVTAAKARVARLEAARGRSLETAAK